MSVSTAPAACQLAGAEFPRKAGDPCLAGAEPQQLARLGLLAPLESQQTRTSAARNPSRPVPLARGSVRWQGYEVSETVSGVDRRGQEQAVLQATAERLARHCGLWVRLSPTPWPYAAAFCFRVDYDQYHPEDFRRMWDALEEAAEWSSHFVNARAYQHATEAACVLRGLHVGGHGYHHHTYRDPQQNRQNIARGLEVLHALGLEPRGFAAPGGRHPAELPQVLEELGVEFSSEFQSAWDCLPFWPCGSSVLQVPIHPICLGSFLEAARAGRRTASPGEQALARAAQAAQEYFCRLVEERLSRGEWVVVYGHPTGRLGRFPDVVRAVVRQVRCTPGVWKTTLLQMARWWQFRRQVAWRTYCLPDGVELWGPRQPGPWTPQVEIHRQGRVALVPLRPGRVRLGWDQLAWHPGPPQEKLPGLKLEPLERSLRERFKNWLDWEKETPVAELPLGGLAATLKKTLRLLRR